MNALIEIFMITFVEACWAYINLGIVEFLILSQSKKDYLSNILNTSTKKQFLTASCRIHPVKNNVCHMMQVNIQNMASAQAF